MSYCDPQEINYDRFCKIMLGIIKVCEVCGDRDPECSSCSTTPQQSYPATVEEEE